MTAAGIFAEFAIEGGKVLAELAAGNITEREASARMVAAMDRLKAKQQSVDEALAAINAKWLAEAAALPRNSADARLAATLAEMHPPATGPAPAQPGPDSGVVT